MSCVLLFLCVHTGMTEHLGSELSNTRDELEGVQAALAARTQELESASSALALSQEVCECVCVCVCLCVCHSLI